MEAEDRVEIRAMALAEDYFKRAGWTVKNVARARGEHSGYDLYLTMGHEQMTVEVKGCTRPYGIPASLPHRV